MAAVANYFRLKFGKRLREVTVKRLSLVKFGERIEIVTLLLRVFCSLNQQVGPIPNIRRVEIVSLVLLC